MGIVYWISGGKKKEKELLEMFFRIIEKFNIENKYIPMLEKSIKAGAKDLIKRTEQEKMPYRIACAFYMAGTALFLAKVFKENNMGSDAIYMIELSELLEAYASDPRTGFYCEIMNEK